MGEAARIKAIRESRRTSGLEPLPRQHMRCWLALVSAADVLKGVDFSFNKPLNTHVKRVQRWWEECQHEFASKKPSMRAADEVSTAYARMRTGRNWSESGISDAERVERWVAALIAAWHLAGDVDCISRDVIKGKRCWRYYSMTLNSLALNVMGNNPEAADCGVGIYMAACPEMRYD